MNDYDLIYIIQPELEQEETQGVNDRVLQTISTNEGELVETEVWGRRKLAYPIKNHFEGYYVIQTIKLPPSSVQEVERNLRLNEDIIRFLFIRTD